MISNFDSVVCLFAMSAVLMSCERVIDLDVGENPSLPVLNFRLDAASGQILGNISQSVDYFSPEAPSLVLDAEVVLSGEDGMSYPLISQALTGFYVNQEMDEAFANGETATLEVVLNGSTFRALNAAPESGLRLDSLELLDVPDFGFGPPDPLDSLKSEYQVVLHFPADSVSHNLLIEYFVDGEPVVDVIQVFKTSPEAVTTVPLGWNQRFFEPGEAVAVWAWTIPEVSFDYWLALSNIVVTGGPGAVPGNPPNHWDQEALGHFTVGRLDVAEIIIPD